MDSKRRRGHITAVASALLALGALTLLLGALGRDRAPLLKAQSPSTVSQSAGQAKQAFVIPSVRAGSLQNKVLHWAQTTDSYTSTSPDPANGKQVTRDVWLETDANLKVMRFHSRSTLQDGTFLQEHIQDGVQEKSILGSIYNAPSPPAGIPSGATSGACSMRLLQGPHTIAEDLLFVDSKILPQVGFNTIVGGSVVDLPTTHTPTGLSPEQAYGSGGKTQGWSIQEHLANGDSVTTELSVTGEGRLPFYQVLRTNPQGQVISQFRVTSGTLEVYSLNPVPTSVFDPSSDVQAV
ncbi:MAG: hypothetical protein ACR2PL_08145, partial [Dehalococcoidia bacterium]